MTIFINILAALLLFTTQSHSTAQAQTLDKIKAKGVIVVGTKTDFPPFGYMDAAGNIVGLEPELAADIAKRLGVRLEIVPVTSANRMKFLQEGKIDLMIATMSVTEEREKVVGIITPHYYATRIGLMAPKAKNIRDEGDLKGRTICSLAGAFFNNRLQTEFTQKDLLLFPNLAEIEAALQKNLCDGFVFDDVLLIYKKRSEGNKWDDYEVIEMTEFDPVPWGIAVRLEEKNGPWGRKVSEIVADWLRSEQLLAWEKKWVGQNTTWLQAVSLRMKGEAKR